MSPKYLLGEEGIWKICLWRSSVLLAGTTFNTGTVKHFSMQELLPSCCNQCQGVTWQPRTRGARGGEAPARMEENVENSSPGSLVTLQARQVWHFLREPASPISSVLASHSWLCGAVHSQFKGTYLGQFVQAQYLPGDALLPPGLLWWLSFTGGWATGTGRYNLFSGLCTAGATEGWRESFIKEVFRSIEVESCPKY